ncbi:MAG: hypothetical protein WCF85_17510 [Rhodospirillaceae bacterium]
MIKTMIKTGYPRARPLSTTHLGVRSGVKSEPGSAIQRRWPLPLMLGFVTVVSVLLWAVIIKIVLVLLSS